ncbi:MAG TPA: hypothetical protein DEA08_26440, partial [Planctomycetes bacterium]|nr:hypothetical protein [Planctomycetota bacterium]
AKIAEATIQNRPPDLSELKAEVLAAVQSAGGGRDGAKVPVIDAKTFAALAREVKGLKSAVEGLLDERDPVQLFQSEEFKAAFDHKIKGVLSYVEGDLVPKAIKNKLQEDAS